LKFLFLPLNPLLIFTLQFIRYVYIHRLLALVAPHPQFLYVSGALRDAVMRDASTLLLSKHGVDPQLMCTLCQTWLRNVPPVDDFPIRN
jgi:hypothetical protein